MLWTRSIAESTWTSSSLHSNAVLFALLRYLASLNYVTVMRQYFRQMISVLRGSPLTGHSLDTLGYEFEPWLTNSLHDLKSLAKREADITTERVDVLLRFYFVSLKMCQEFILCANSGRRYPSLQWRTDVAEGRSFASCILSDTLIDDLVDKELLAWCWKCSVDLSNQVACELGVGLTPGGDIDFFVVAPKLIY